MKLPKTKEALRIYDEQHDALVQKMMDAKTSQGTMDAFAEIEALEEAVGVAFGEDTQDINSIETCRQCVRPGPKVPGPGCELSFVRRCVAKAHAECHMRLLQPGEVVREGDKYFRQA